MSSEWVDSQCSLLDLDVPHDVTKRYKGFWRRKDPIMDALKERVVVKGGMWPEQRRWWKLQDFIRVFVGGYGCGKSLIGGKWAISMALANAPVPFGCVSPSFPLARKTMIPTIIELLSGKQTLLGSALYWKYRKIPGALEFEIQHHGRKGTIYIMSGEDPLSLRGPNLCGALIDEPFIQNVEVFRQMMARVRHPDAPYPAIGLTGTPEQLNWGYELCMGDMKAEYEATGLTIGMVQASTRSNLAVGDGYVKRLEGTFSGKTAEAYVDGAFVNLSKGIVMYGFSRDKNKVEIPWEFRDGRLQVFLNGMWQFAEWGCGMDFNVNPMAFIVFWHTQDHMHFVEEFELENSDTEYACSVLKESDRGMGRKGPNYFNLGLRQVFPDPSGNSRKTSAPGAKTDFHYIRDAGFLVRARHAHPVIRDLENAVNGRLAPRKGAPNMTISEKCKKLISYYSTYSHELKKKQESMSHLIRASQYPTEILFPVVRDTPIVTVISGT